MQRDRYTIGLVCALPVEFAAMCDMLDREHDPLPRVRDDDNVYTLGQIGAHNVVIACLPSGSTGTISASLVGNKLRTSFPIKFGLMVGIAGGCPSAEHDVRLGDVVVSKPNGRNGGVVQFDFGKSIGGGEFEITGQLNRPHPILLAATAHLEAQRMRRGHRIHDIISAAEQRNPEMKRRSRHLGAGADVLFQANYEHPPGHPTCDYCQREYAIERYDRGSALPMIFSGAIASGNRVMRDGMLRDHLARDNGFLCFEMEAAGLMNDFPCLVVRGICDYADTHKNKAWQPYAAVVAAAHARELLEVIPPEESPTLPGAPPQHLSPSYTPSYAEGRVSPMPERYSPSHSVPAGSAYSMDGRVSPRPVVYSSSHSPTPSHDRRAQIEQYGYEDPVRQLQNLSLSSQSPALPPRSSVSVASYPYEGSLYDGSQNTGYTQALTVGNTHRQSSNSGPQNTGYTQALAAGNAHRESSNSGPQVTGYTQELAEQSQGGQEQKDRKKSGRSWLKGLFFYDDDDEHGSSKGQGQNKSTRPPGQLAFDIQQATGPTGALNVKIRSRGHGTYILVVNDPVTQRGIVCGEGAWIQVKSNHVVCRSAVFAGDFTSGRPHRNTFVWQLMPGQTCSTFTFETPTMQPNKNVRVSLYCAPQGTRLPMGLGWPGLCI